MKNKTTKKSKKAPPPKKKKISRIEQCPECACDYTGDSCPNPYCEMFKVDLDVDDDVIE